MHQVTVAIESCVAFPNKKNELSMLARSCVTAKGTQIYELCKLDCNGFVTHLVCQFE